LASLGREKSGVRVVSPGGDDMGAVLYHFMIRYLGIRARISSLLLKALPKAAIECQQLSSLDGIHII
jgi:hypothetical protein